MISQSHFLYKIIISRRTIRAFKQKPLSIPFLKKLVNAARLAPSAANLQSLEFIVITDKDLRRKIFPCLRWAAYIAPYGLPPEGKRPMAYIIILVNKSKTSGRYVAYDVGAAAENILLAAWAQGIGSCWLQSIERGRLRRILRIPPRYNVDSTIALGYPDERPVLEDVKGSVKYWKDSRGVLHVPKRKLNQVLRCVKAD
jgi:nitroreductase